MGAVLPFLTVVLAGCLKGPTVNLPPVETPIQVIVTPSNAEVFVGGTQTFVAQVTGGDSLTVRSVTWSVQPATGVASVQPSGNTATVTGLGVGSASVIATHAGGAAAAAALRVVALPPTPVDRVDVTPDAATVLVGATTQLGLAVLDVAGNALTGRMASWQSGDPAILMVSSSGLVTGLAPGTAVARATVEAKTDSSVITVVAAAPAGRFGYVYADAPSTASYTANAATSFNSAGQPIAITRLGSGQYLAIFQGLQFTSAEPRVAHVTAYGPGTDTCKVVSAYTHADGAAVIVNCFTTADMLVDAPFLLLLLGADALPGRFAFGWADQPTASFTYTPTVMHSSNGGNLQVFRDDSGIYRVLFGGHGRPQGGPPETALVGSTGNAPTRCTVNGFLTGEMLAVHCVGPSDTAFYIDDTPFVAILLEQGPPGRRFAFATATGQAAVPTDQAFSSSGGAITASRLGSGRTDVTFAGLGRNGAGGAETVQLVARSDQGAFCKVIGWQAGGADVVASVQCYEYYGTPSDEEFRIVVMH